MNTGVVRTMLASDTNISPDVLESRTWWLLNFPIVQKDATSTFVNTAVKYVVSTISFAARHHRNHR